MHAMKKRLTKNLVQNSYIRQNNDIKTRLIVLIAVTLIFIGIALIIEDLFELQRGMGFIISGFVLLLFSHVLMLSRKR